jgi:hypothetical protein
MRGSRLPSHLEAKSTFVEVPAIVTDESGAFVRGLTADDFQIYAASCR